MSTTPSPTAFLERLHLSAYQVAEAARYAHTTPRTVARWYFGGGDLGPILPGKERKIGLSYLQLVEVAFVASFRQMGISSNQVRRAREYLQQAFGFEYPFAQQRLYTEGRHILVRAPDDWGEELRKVIVADRQGQYAWPKILAERFEQFDYDYNLAVRWHPAGRRSSVTIDPRISFGAPAVRGVSTVALKHRFEAGEGIAELSEDFAVPEDEVRQALTFEGVKLAA
ncbi:MAG: DUF433 domain-containing protein [Chloroflexi bacterium]|nr:DUF433 domain-containing protein [Chloroflexota bacterium]MCL5109482.1 DUF433 domain-containing protein [Chloroflexota bacterium]